MLLSSELKENIPLWSDFAEGRHAAVLYLMIQYPEGTFVLLTRRSVQVRTHKGQIGFPGGRKEAQDKSPKDTALREAYEEVGLVPESVQVRGYIDPRSALDGSLVVPIIGQYIHPTPPEFAISPAEVEELILTPIHRLKEDVKEVIYYKLFGLERKTYLYRYQHHKIWGLTANIISSINLEAI